MSSFIPKEHAGHAQAWAAPDLSQRGARGGVAEVAGGVALPTADELSRVFEQARAQGWAEGQREGHAQGRQAGLDEARAQGAAELAALRGLLQRLQQPASRLDAELEDAVVALALEVARQVVLHEVHSQPQALLEIVQRALAAFPASAGAPWVRLHPDDVSMLRQLAPELEDGGVSLLPDETLQRGDLVLASGGEASRASPERRWRPRAARDVQAELDLRLEERWRQVIARLFEEGAL